MKPYSLIFPILLMAAQLATAQDNPITRKLIFKISVSDSGLNMRKGYLSNITDTTIKLSHWPVRFGVNPTIQEPLKEVGYSQIKEMTLKRNHGAGRGAWKGAVIGFLTGVAAGFIEGDDPEESWFALSAFDKAIIYGGLGATAGTGIGALVGAFAKKKFIIGGRKENFDAMKANVLNKAYGNTNSHVNSQ